MPAIIVGVSLKKGSKVFMDLLPGFSIHCFVGFGGDSVQAGRFSVLQLIDCDINFFESDGVVNVMEGLALGDVVEYGLVNRAMVIEDTVKWGPNTAMFSLPSVLSFPSAIFMAI